MTSKKPEGAKPGTEVNAGIIAIPEAPEPIVSMRDRLLSLLEYASLSMALEVIPHRAHEVFAMFGLSDEGARAHELAGWEQYFAQHPREKTQLATMRGRTRERWLEFDRTTPAKDQAGDEAEEPMEKVPTTSVTPNELSLLEYASLSMALELLPHRAEELFARFGLKESGLRESVLAHWEVHFDDNPGDRAELARMRMRMRDYWLQFDREHPEPLAEIAPEPVPKTANVSMEALGDTPVADVAHVVDDDDDDREEAPADSSPDSWPPDSDDDDEAKPRAKAAKAAKGAKDASGDSTPKREAPPPVPAPPISEPPPRPMAPAAEPAMAATPAKPMKPLEPRMNPAFAQTAPGTMPSGPKTPSSSEKRAPARGAAGGARPPPPPTAVAFQSPVIRPRRVLETSGAPPPPPTAMAIKSPFASANAARSPGARPVAPGTLTTGKVEARAPSRAEPIALPLSLLEYAVLCVRVQMEPDKAEDAFARVGLADKAKRKWLDDAWQARLRENPEELDEWKGHVSRMRKNWGAPIKR